MINRNAIPWTQPFQVAGYRSAANVAGLSVVRDVLLGVLFMLWTAWWISLLVVFARQTQTASTTELPDEPETNVLRP
jgi:hypothetical protein